MTKKEQLLYMAGFFDGEGCVGLNKCRSLGATHAFPYRVEVQISQVRKEPLEMFQKRYGGGIYLTKRSLKNPNWQDVHHWVIGDRAAEKCLRDMLPHLTLKKDKARLCLEWRDLPKLSRIANLQRVGRPSKIKAKKRNEKIIKERRKIYGKFKGLV